MRLIVARTEDEFAHEAADAICEVVAGRPGVALGLPSGKTPLSTYAEIARRVAAGEADFSQATVFAIDELYGVSPDHPATNASYFRRHLIEHVRLRAFHCLRSDAPDPEAACAAFARLIEGAGGLELIVLGIGTNGHIAFNEPGSPFDSRCRVVALEPASREAYAAAFGSLDATPERGLTLGIADILGARRALLLASGEGKADVVARALHGPVTEAVPGSALQRHPALTVIVDEGAASRLAPGAA